VTLLKEGKYGKHVLMDYKSEFYTSVVWCYVQSVLSDDKLFIEMNNEMKQMPINFIKILPGQDWKIPQLISSHLNHIQKLQING